MRHRAFLFRADTGYALTLAVLGLVLVAAGAVLAAVVAFAGMPERDRVTERALVQARDALVSYAADRAIDREVGPGYLPCPDRDGDGWAEPTCGSLAGDIGQAQRLGLLPWKTLGLPELRDGHGERLWYAVSTKHKGLLNCAASAACTDMSPLAAVGTLTLRDAGGALLNDGRLTLPGGAPTGAAALVIAPGPPLTRADGREQRRGCLPGTCDPADFLDVLPGVGDNARAIDRADASGRAANTEGYVAGPAALAGRPIVNDRIVAVGYEDLMPRVMARVALEAGHCMRLGAAAAGALPEPEPACGPALGRVPDVGAAGCNLGPATAPGWWKTWKPHVLYARAARCDGAQACIEVVDGEGRPRGAGRRLGFSVAVAPARCETAPWNCQDGECLQVRAARGSDVVVALP